MADGKRDYEIEVGSEAAAQFRWLRRHDRDAANRVEDAIEARLTFEPTQGDRNRKTTGEGAAADWELRVQPYRVFYNVNEAARLVTVVAVFRKPRETATPLPED